jgi:hypothetical protein
MGGRTANCGPDVYLTVDRLERAASLAMLVLAVARRCR